MSFIRRLLMGRPLVTPLSPDIISKDIGHPHDNADAYSDWSKRYRIAIQCENMQRAIQMSKAVTK